MTRQRLLDPELVHVVDQTDVGGPVAWVGEPAHHDPEPPAVAVTLEEWRRAQERGAPGSVPSSAASGGPGIRRRAPHSAGDQVPSPGPLRLAGGPGASPADGQLGRRS